MSTRKRKLPAESQDAHDLVAAIQQGEIPISYTAQKILALPQVPIASRLKVYSVRSINDFLNNYRRRSDTFSG